MASRIHIAVSCGPFSDKDARVEPGWHAGEDEPTFRLPNPPPPSSELVKLSSSPVVDVCLFTDPIPAIQVFKLTSTMSHIRTYWPHSIMPPYRSSRQLTLKRVTLKMEEVLGLNIFHVKMKRWPLKF